MMPFLPSRAFTVTLALLFSLIISPLTVQARTPSEKWVHEFHEGRDFYVLGNPAAPVNALVLACGLDGDDYVPTRIGYLIGGKRPPPNSSVKLITSALSTAHSFEVDEESGTTVACRACAENFTFLWTHLRRSKSVTLMFADGRKAVLPMPNVEQVLPRDPCPAID